MISNVSLNSITEARNRIRGSVHYTPLLHSSKLGGPLGIDLYFKCENLQKTGSFKVRGVLNKLYNLQDAEKKAGVVTISAGNHAQALAWASQAAGIHAKVVMPETAPKAKINASKGYGAEVLLHGNVIQAFEKALQIAKDEGRTFVHPFEDPFIISGHGTVGLEILEQLPDTDVVVVGIGGGALSTGVAAAVRLTRPQARIYGVEPVGASSMRKSLDAGKAVRLDKVETIADGLGSPMAGELTYALTKRYVDDVFLVTDDEIAAAMGDILAYAKLLTEPAGAAGTAALQTGRIPVKQGDKVVAILSGGNIDLDRFCGLTA